MALQAWTGRTSGQIDADSPVDVVLVGGMDDDFTHLRQVLYGDGAGGFRTPIDGHNHLSTGANSAPLAANDIPGGKFNTVPSTNASIVIATSSLWNVDGAVAVSNSSDAEIRVDIYSSFDTAWTGLFPTNSLLFYDAGTNARVRNTSGVGGRRARYILFET